MRCRPLVIFSIFITAACGARFDQSQSYPAPPIARDYDVAPFDTILLDGPYDAVVTPGAAAVMARGDSTLIGQLAVTVQGGRLRIGNVGGSGRNWSGRPRSATVYVTLPALRAVQLAGSGNMRIARIEGGAFDAEVAGSGNLALDRVDLAQATLVGSGSGNVDGREGRIASVQVRVRGSGSIDLGNIESRDADISVEASGNAQLLATGAARIAIRASGTATVRGGARCTIERRGSGDATCR